VHTPDGAEESGIAFGFQPLHCLVGKSFPGLLESSPTCFKVDERETQPERDGESFENSASGWDDFAAYAVAGDESCFILASVVYERLIDLPSRSVRAAMKYFKRN
jgi:hypothetical protein